MQPVNSPWGKVQESRELCKGIYKVVTADGGGIIVEPESVVYLTTAARKCGFRDEGHLCFEENTQEDVVFRDLLDSGLWKIPKDILDPSQHKQMIDESVRKNNPEYWRARQLRIQKRSGKRVAAKKAHLPAR